MNWFFVGNFTTLYIDCTFFVSLCFLLGFRYFCLLTFFCIFYRINQQYQKYAQHFNQSETLCIIWFTVILVNNEKGVVVLMLLQYQRWSL